MMFWLATTAALALASPCEVGGKGAQCVTCVPSDRGTQVCRGVCYYIDPKRPRPDGGHRSEPLKAEDKDESAARKKVDDQAKEKCG